MRAILPDRLTEARVWVRKLARYRQDGPNGCFILQGPCGEELRIISNDASGAEAEGWEHVSVSVAKRRPPNWREMCFVKDLFWGDEETVIQFHPPKSEYVNNHLTCLHLWRDTTNGHRLPPSHFVGVKDMDNMSPEETAAMKVWREGNG
jgi:hypothetical protein